MSNQENKYIVVQNNEEYDISEFLRNHPGGKNYLQLYTGSKVKEKMLKTDHSSSAMYLLREYKIGGRDQSTIDGQEDLESLLDWNKAILPQVGKLGKRYNEWVAAPVDRKLRLFESSVLEMLTITPWYIVPLFWTPIILYFIFSGIIQYISFQPAKYYIYAIPAIVLNFFLGILLWTLLEYSLHRWVFHMEPTGESKAFIYFHFAIHGLHHKVPFDSRRLVFPPIPAAVIATAGYFLYSLIFPASVLKLVVAGSISGYVIYDMIHFYLHNGSPSENSYLYYLKRYHNQHHFCHSESGFGISNLFWDKIFGTAISLRKLAVGIKW